MKKGRCFARALLFLLMTVFVGGMFFGTGTAKAEGIVDPLLIGEMLKNPIVTSWKAYEEKTGKEANFWTIVTAKDLVKDYTANKSYLAQLSYTYGRDYEKVPPFWTAYGTRVETGKQSSLRSLEVGEHFYQYERSGNVPVGYWRVNHEYAGCIHFNDTYYAGKDWTPGVCYKPYPSGWLAYCADCGNDITETLIYAEEWQIRMLGVVDTSAMYVYECPHCSSLENQGNQAHECKAISWNMYKVTYDDNVGAGVTGYMESSYHMYNNETMRNGEPVLPLNHLSRNNYVREGYTFVGWNTKPDGTGTFYEDGAEILNLSQYDYEADENREGTDKGRITLYAQWKDTKSTLRIDPNGGKFNDKTGITSLTKGYAERENVSADRVTPPGGVPVHFDSQGGGHVDDILSTMRFSSWKQSNPFNGKVKKVSGKEYYYFYGDDGVTDTLKAMYEFCAIVLPDAPTPPPGENPPSFGGWSKDPEGKYPVGKPGDLFTPIAECTLYAQWSTLVLDSVENYVANEQKGACDLTWIQPDTTEKSYKIYRSENGTDFSQLYAADIDYDNMSVDKTYDYSGAAKTFTIPYDGYYKFEAWGAQGENFTEGGTLKHTGGLGGYASATFYLYKGDVITIDVGGQNGHNGGGKGEIFGNGGGMTSVSSKTYGPLLIAGGGGGASKQEDGGGGGLETSLRSDNASIGADGSSGGGGGRIGGNAGAQKEHEHDRTCEIPHEHTKEKGCYTPVYHVHTGACASWSYNYCRTEVIHKRTYELREQYYNQIINDFRDMAGNPQGGVCLGGWHTECVTEWAHKYLCSWCQASYPNKCMHGTTTSCTKGGTIERWDLTCEKKNDGHSCGFEPGQVEPASVKGAFGGSSFIKTTGVDYCNYSMEGAKRTGNGMLKVTSYEVGFTTELKLDGAVSPDLEAPDKIEKSGVVKKAISSSEIKLTFDRPTDNGTDYWWRVDSYANATTIKLLESNITKNTLITGVKGYYYEYDYEPTHGENYLATLVSGGNAVSYKAKTSDPAKDSVSVTTMPSTTYLHIAPVDVAGNVGKTIDIKIDPGAQAYPIVTDQVQISSTINGRDQGTVYQSPLDGKIYVRADGAGAFKLSYNSFMDGEARANYQINRQTFAIALDTPGTESRFVSHLPYSNPIKAGEDVVDPRTVARYMYGTSIFRDIQNFSAARYNDARKNHFEQCFAVYPSYDGKVLVVTPVAGASVGDDEDDTVTSEWSDDILHSLTLYPDGKAPDILGLETLATMTTIDRNMGLPSFHVTATDALSGVKSLKVIITNQNNGLQKVYYPNALGEIDLDFNGPDVELFNGDLSVEAIAIDNVGNVNQIVYGTQVFTLDSRIKPSTVKKGGFFTLQAVTRGFADRLVIELPPELQPGNEGLQLEYNYPTHVNFYESEVLLVRVPRDCPATTYTVTVRAYKNGEMLENFPQVTVLDEYAFEDVRVRIR